MNSSANLGSTSSFQNGNGFGNAGAHQRSCTNCGQVGHYNSNCTQQGQPRAQTQRRNTASAPPASGYIGLLLLLFCWLSCQLALLDPCSCSYLDMSSSMSLASFLALGKCTFS